MIDALLIDIIRSGSIAFVGSKVVKAFGEKEISEIIAGTGWLVVGVDMVMMVSPVVKGIQTFFDKATNMFNAIGNAFEKLTNIPMIGEFIKRGMVESGSSITGKW